MRMSRLKELDLLVTEEKISWRGERRWVDGLINDIQLTKEKYSDWVCPRVTLLNRDSGKELSVIPGGVWSELIEDEEGSGEQIV